MFRFYSKAAGMVKSLLAFLGCVFLTFGTLIFIFPKFFAFVAAAAFVLIGIGLMLSSLWVRVRPVQGNPPPSKDDGFSSYEEIED